MKKSIKLLIIIWVITLCCSTVLLGQDKIQGDTNPLSSFSRLVGGKWVLGNSHQIFEWGVGKLSVKSENFFDLNGSPKLVAEGSWFWHPGENRIKGTFTAIQMPAVLFEYVTHFEDKKMINELTTYNADGKREDYTEVWEFLDDNTIDWKLFQNKGGGEQLIMEGAYKRVPRN